MKPSFKLLFLLFFSLFALIGGAYFLINFFSGGTCVLGAFEGSSNYHCVFPYQYIAIPSFVLSLAVWVWVMYCKNVKKPQRYVYGVLLAFAVGICSSILGGMLWATHELLLVGDHRGMGWFGFYLFEIYNTTTYAWIAVLKSFPLNITVIGVVWGCALVAKRFLKNRKRD